MADQVNYYEVLGVPRNASQSEIKNAYRRLAKERHPDHAGGSKGEFNRLQEAHAVLSDPNRRRRHDEALDLAYAAEQLADLNVDFGSLDDELSQKRSEREASSGPTLSERLRGRFRRSAEPARSGRGRQATQSGAHWYQPHRFDPDPVTWKTGAISFIGAFLALIVIGQIGLWATGGARPGSLSWLVFLAPAMPILYCLVGLVAAYLSYKAAGWAGMALVFVAVLVVGGSGGPEGSVQFATLGIVILLALIYLGNRRDRTTWHERH